MTELLYQEQEANRLVCLALQKSKDIHTSTRPAEWEKVRTIEEPYNTKNALFSTLNEEKVEDE